MDRHTNPSGMGAGAAANRAEHRFSFTGSASEYFGIWIVNILLTIITFGIYSAWAKVRRNRYFYGNTELAGRRFDYHATGGQILIGRLIVLAGLLFYNVIVTILPLLALLFIPVFLFLVPFLIARGLRFSARVTSYRNVRFDFIGKPLGAFVAFTVGPLLAVVSLGVLAPLASRWTYRYTLGHLRYGNKAFATDPPLGQLYRVWVLPALITLLGLVLLVGVAGAVAVAANQLSVAGGAVGYVPILILFVLFGVLAISGPLYRAGTRNVAYGATLFDERHALKSDMPRWRYMWITVSNIIVTLATLGLMRPWAAVRLARFQADHTAMAFEGDVGGIMSLIEQEGSAIGAEYMDVEGIDIGF